jgi:hypothetical protein
VPLLLTYGTESPRLFPAVITELAKLVSAGRVEVLEGAGHIPHATHPDEWIARLTAFHDQCASVRQYELGGKQDRCRRSARVVGWANRSRQGGLPS